MSRNPYAPPEASVESAEAAGARADAPIFFPVSTIKLGVMSFCTLGLYEMYWFYMNWRLVKRRDNSGIWPVPRAIFSVFFCHSLFERMRRDGTARSLAGAPAMSWLALSWIVLNFLWRLPDPYWLVSMLGFVPVIVVQAYVNRINAVAAPGHDANGRFSLLNCVGVVAGALLWIVAIVGLTMPAGA